MTAKFQPHIWRGLIFLVIFSLSHGFYMPGLSIKSYKENEAIPLLVNKVFSENSQLQYAYYSLPFVCPPSGTHHAGSSLLSGQTLPLNLGEVLRGDRIQQSDIELVLGRDTECEFLCNRTVNSSALKRAKQLIKEGYVVEWIVDNLPGATSFVTVDKSRKYYVPGFKLGYSEPIATSGKNKYYLNNHLTIVIKYRKASGKDGEKGRKVIVGFEVYTKSIGNASRRSDGCPANLDDINIPLELSFNSNIVGNLTNSAQSSSITFESNSKNTNSNRMNLNIPYTYSVYWLENDQIEWSHRWDLYFVNQEAGSKIHWLAIINSLIISGLLSTVVAMILARTIRAEINTGKDIIEESERARLSWRRKSSLIFPSKNGQGGLLEQVEDEGNDADISSDEEALGDQSGWKLLPGDVFRLPEHGWLLAHLVVSGIQLLFMAIGLLFLSTVGILNPSFRGSFISAGFGLFIFNGVFSGYFSGRIYRTFGGLDWRRNALITAIFFPGVLFTFFFILNLFIWAQASSTALPFSTLIAIIILWLCIQLPLVFIGSWYGYIKSGVWEHPTRASPFPRQIPPQSWYIRNPQSILLAGFIPFAVIFVELTFVFQSLWQEKSGSYYVFGFLSVVSIILITTIIEVTIVSVFIKLSSEDYRWWWHSFAVGGGSSIWVFAYCVWYYFSQIQIKNFVNGFLFFSYSAIACVVYGLLCGTIGFLTAYEFVRRIYGAIKVD